MNYGFYATSTGIAKITKAIQEKVKLDITHVAVGSGGDPSADINFDITELVDEKYRKEMVEGDSYEVDPLNPNVIKIVTVIPDDVGNFNINEVGYFDSDGDLVIYGVIRTVQKEQGIGGNLRIVELDNYIAFDNNQIEHLNIVVRCEEQEKFRQEILDIVNNIKIDRITEREIYEICFGQLDEGQESLPIEDVANLLDGDPSNDPDYSMDSKEKSLSDDEIDNLLDGDPTNDPTWEEDDGSMELDDVMYILET